MKTLYHECQLSSETDMPGRLYCGISNAGVTLVVQKEFEKLLGNMTSFQATRGCFNLGKVYKELFRGGDAGPNGDYKMRNYDLSTSFAMAISERHPDLNFVKDWIYKNAEVVASTGLTREQVKDLISSAAGIGQRGIKVWLNKVGVQALPDFCKGCLKDFCVARQRDYDANADLRARIEDPTLSKNDVMNLCAQFQL